MIDDNLISELVEKYKQISNIDTITDMKIECGSLFEDIHINASFDEILEFIDNVKMKILLTSTDITDKYREQRDIVKTMRSQVGFFLAFYSFLVSKLSFTIDDEMKDEIASWLVDILSNLNIGMGNSDWKIFMANFVISFHPYISSVLLEIYECLGLDIPREIEPVNYTNDEDIKFDINVPVVKERKKRVVKKVDLEESLAALKSKESNVYRPELYLDRPLATLNDIKEKHPINLTKPLSRSKSSAPRLENSRSKQVAKSKDPKDPKDSSAKKIRRRKTLAPETPNIKDDYVPRPLRIAAAAAKKLKKTLVIAVESPLPDRNRVSTPTTQARIRRAKYKSNAMLKELSGPVSAADFWVKRRQEEERSLTSFSAESFDLQGTNSFPSTDNSSKRITRFSARLFESFMSPIKDVNSVPAKPHDIHTPNKSNETKQFSIFSPRKVLNKQTPPKTEIRPSFTSPRKGALNESPTTSTSSLPKKNKNSVNTTTPPKSTTKISFMSPRKGVSNVPSNMPFLFSPKKMQTPPKLVTIVKTTTPLKSCLKSPLKRNRFIIEKSEKNTSLKRRKTIISQEFPSSVLLSPKVKQRTFAVNCPPQDYCEDTMFMDTKEFIRSSGSKAAMKQDHNMKDNLSPIPSYFNENSQSSFDSIPIERVKSAPRRKLSVQRKLFDTGPSNISLGNILQKNRRNTVIATPNFFNLEPDTDESNGFKI